ASVAAAMCAASDAGSGLASEEEGEEAEEEDKEGTGSDFAAGNAARNSAIGFQADFVSSQARSAALRLPSATFSRMADSENRPAYCPFRCTQISMSPYLSKAAGLVQTKYTAL